jgi:exodeoxyribonuclease VII large subunit
MESLRKDAKLKDGKEKLGGRIVYNVSEVISNFNSQLSQIYEEGIYVRGEVSSLSRNDAWYYTYFDLIEAADEKEQLVNRNTPGKTLSRNRKKIIIKCILKEEQKQHTASEAKLTSKKNDEKKSGVENNLTTTKAKLEAGMIGVFLCKPVLYEGNGSLSFKVTDYSLQSVTGKFIENLKRRYELLKKQGFFDKKKRPITRYPQNIAIICGNRSAVYFDILKNLYERWPLVDVHVERVLVQGEEAVYALIESIDKIVEINKKRKFDFLIIARGGGSFIDLLPFFDAMLVEKIYSLELPIVSAIGHETDNPYIDDVADVRISTPSMIVSLVPDIDEEIKSLQLLQRGVFNVLDERVNNESHSINAIQISSRCSYLMDLKFKSEEYDLHNLTHSTISNTISIISDRLLKMQNIKNLIARELATRIVKESQIIASYTEQLRSFSKFTDVYVQKFQIYEYNEGGDFEDKAPLLLSQLETAKKYCFVGKGVVLGIELLEKKIEREGKGG